MFLKPFFTVLEFVAFIMPALPEKLTTRLSVLGIYFVMHSLKLQYTYANFKKTCLKNERNNEMTVEYNLDDTTHYFYDY